MSRIQVHAQLSWVCKKFYNLGASWNNIGTVFLKHLAWSEIHVRAISCTLFGIMSWKYKAWIFKIIRTKIKKAILAFSVFKLSFLNSYILSRLYRLKMEPVHENSNNVVCATSKASDQPAHTRSLIRAFASRSSILWLLNYWLNTIWSF